MKFGELKVGAMFTVGGETFVKTSPMIGRCEKTGAQKFIRRSVDVDLWESRAEPKPATKNHQLSRTQVINAFAEFFAHCETCVQQLAPELDAQLLISVQEQLEKAKQRFMRKIS